MNLYSKVILKPQQGFTLIEIVIALAIVAIAVLGIANAMNHHTQIASQLDKRVVASWVAGNVAAELRHSAKTERIKVGSSSDSVEMGGHKWRTTSHITETDVEQVFKVRIEVKDDKAGEANEYASIVTAIRYTP